MSVCLLDTDTLSEILKQKNASVTARATAYLQTYHGFTFSAIARYEIIRGLKAKNAIWTWFRPIFASGCPKPGSYTY